MFFLANLPPMPAPALIFLIFWAGAWPTCILIQAILGKALCGRLTYSIEEQRWFIPVIRRAERPVAFWLLLGVQLTVYVMLLCLLLNAGRPA